MNHTTMKKIAFVLSFSMVIHPVTQCYDWATKSVFMAILGTTVIAGGAAYYFKFKAKPNKKKDLVKITLQEECSAPSQNTPQPTEEIKIRPVAEIELEPLLSKLVIEEHTLNNPASVEIHIRTVTEMPAVDVYEEALSIGSLNDPFNN